MQRLSRERQAFLKSAVPSQVVTTYLQAINQHDYDLALACLDREAFGGGVTPDSYLATLQKIESISDIVLDPPGTGGARPDSPTRAWVVVEYTQCARPDQDVLDGRLMRFADVRRASAKDRWRLVILSSSP